MDVDSTTKKGTKKSAQGRKKIEKRRSKKSSIVFAKYKTRQPPKKRR
jgi:hypothetical protein